MIVGMAGKIWALLAKTNHLLSSAIEQEKVMSEELTFIENEEGKFAVPCQIKIAENCVQVGEFCESKADARGWAEEECWIFTGEGCFCERCHEQIMRNISNLQTKKMN
jgi:hypothetical protein